MNEEIVRRGPGRPRKEEPRPILHKMKAKPNWEEIDPESFDETTPDKLRISPDLIPEGMSLQWVTDSVYGQPVPQHRAEFEKKGWTPVHQEDFDGVYDGMFMPRGADGEIKMDGLVLMARPEELTLRARLRDKQEAINRVRIKEQAWLGGDVKTTLDSRDPVAVRSNRITRTMERIEVPQDK